MVGSGLLRLLFLTVAFKEVVLFGADPFVAFTAHLIAVVVCQMDEELYKWARAEEDDFLEGYREEEQAQEAATTHDGLDN